MRSGNSKSNNKRTFSEIDTKLEWNEALAEAYSSRRASRTMAIAPQPNLANKNTLNLDNLIKLIQEKIVESTDINYVEKHLQVSSRDFAQWLNDFSKEVKNPALKKYDHFYDYAFYLGLDSTNNSQSTLAINQATSTTSNSTTQNTIPNVIAHENLSPPTQIEKSNIQPLYYNDNTSYNLFFSGNQLSSNQVNTSDPQLNALNNVNQPSNEGTCFLPK
jgi:hypothetical protein